MKTPISGTACDDPPLAADDPPPAVDNPPSGSFSVPIQKAEIENGTNGFPDASSQDPILASELEGACRIASNRSNPLENRLEAFEDVMETEVGDTTLTRVRNIECKFGIRQLYLKFEGGNPTGTQKDRIAFAQAMDAMRRGYDSITAATCGNYGVALSLAASVAGLKCFIFIPSSFHSKRVDEMKRRGADVITVPGDYEATVDVSRKYAEEKDVYDANPGGTNTQIQLMAYSEIAYEIYDELRDAPAAIAVPVSNGTTIAGVYRGFVGLYRRGKTSRIPKIVAGSSSFKNPIIRAFQQKTDRCLDLEPEKIRETSTNAPLVNWHSIDGDHALEAVRKTGGWAGNVSDKTMKGHSKLLEELEGLSVLPASTAALAAFLEWHGRSPLPGDRYVVLLTGRNT